MKRFAASRDILRVKPWVCQELEHLTMGITFPLELQATAGWDEQVFRQLSKLERLQSLNLGQSVNIESSTAHDENARGLQLKLQSGLTLLAPLKNMVTLKFVHTRQNLDEQDLLWILNQWSSLEEMSRGFNENKNIRERLWSLVEAMEIELLLRSYEFGYGSDSEFEDKEDVYSDFK